MAGDGGLVLSPDGAGAGPSLGLPCGDVLGDRLAKPSCGDPVGEAERVLGALDDLCPPG